MKKKSDYYEKLKDPRWQKKRLEILERDGWECRACGEKENTLNIHHVFYLPGKDPWDIPPGLLITFCEKCHKNLPCNDEYKTCTDCPNLDDGMCEGPGDHGDVLIHFVGGLLSTILSNKKKFGEDYNTALSKAWKILNK